MYDKMKKPDLSEICQIEKGLISALNTVVSHGIFSKEVDTKEAGALVDMVKDMAETKRNCWEACYYEAVTKAMEESDEYEGSMGYNMNRYASGRYAPSGTGDMTAGYTPRFHIPGMRPGEIYENPHFMGYSGNSNNNQANQSSENYGYDPTRSMNWDNNNRYGMAFSEYRNARRHYTESRTLEDKNHMDDKAIEHVNQSMMTLREIWKDADPAIKKQVSESISSLATEFKNV